MNRIQSFTTWALLASLLVACTTAPNTSSSESKKFLTWSETNKEYQAAVASFPYPLPEGVTFPTDMRKSDSDYFQTGWGLGQAWSFWECTQMERYITLLPTDPEAAALTLTQLEKSATSAWRQNYVIDPDKIFLTQVIGKSRLGDPSILREFYQSGCVSKPSSTGK